MLTVNTTGDLDIFDYSLAVARGWGIGAKEGERAGLLLVVAIQDRKYFTQVSRHLEGDLPDGLAGQIQRERLVPRFGRETTAREFSTRSRLTLRHSQTKRGFSIDGIDRSHAYASSRKRNRQRDQTDEVSEHVFWNHRHCFHFDPAFVGFAKRCAVAAAAAVVCRHCCGEVCLAI